MVFGIDADSVTRVTIHTTPGCPDCHALKAWLDREGIVHIERDLTDPVFMEEALTRYGVRPALLTAGDGWLASGDFAKQNSEIEASLQERA